MSDVDANKHSWSPLEPAHALSVKSVTRRTVSMGMVNQLPKKNDNQELT